MGMRGPGARGGMSGAGKRAEDEGPIHHPWLNPVLSRAGRVMAFIETLPVTKGILAGKLMKLDEFQQRFIRDIYDPVTEDGRRLVRQAILSMARKNGKTGLVVGIGLAHLVGPEAEDRGEIVSAANDREQAGIIFDEIEAIIHATPWMDALCNVQRFKKVLEVLKVPPAGKGQGSTFEALSSDAKTKHGLSPSVWIYDELGQARNRDLLDALQTAQGGRSEPLGIVISTQSALANHPMSELVDYGEQVNSGAIEDETYVCHVYQAPKDCAILDEEAWKASNPALGTFRDYTDLKTMALRAGRVPAFEPAFRNLFLNQRVDAVARAITASDWDACAELVPLDDLVGQECFGGLDLGSTSDLTAFSLYWPDSGAAWTWQWVPAERIRERVEKDRVPYDVWVKQGLIVATPGRARDDLAIVRKLVEVCGLFDVKSVAFDRWRIEDLKKKLADEGVTNIPLVPHGQGFRDMAPAFDAFETALVNAHLKHGGSPVMRWQASNAVVQMDESGNRKPDKRRSSDKIDGIVSLIMAIGSAQKPGEDAVNIDDWLASLAA